MATASCQARESTSTSTYAVYCTRKLLLENKRALSLLQSLGRPNTALESISMADTSHDSVEKRKKSPVRVTKPKPPGKRKKTSYVERESMDNRATRAWQKAFRRSEGDQPTENNNLHSAFPENDHHVRVEERQYIAHPRTISKIRSTGSRSDALGMVSRKADHVLGCPYIACYASAESDGYCEAHEYSGGVIHSKQWIHFTLQGSPRNRQQNCSRYSVMT